MGWLLFASSDFRDFRAHGPRMRIDGLSAFWEIRRYCRRHHRRLPSRPRIIVSCRRHCFLRQKPSAAAMSVAQHASSPSSTSQGADFAAIIDPSASAPSLHSDPDLRLPFHLRAASPLRLTEEQPPPLVQIHLLLIMASGPAGPLVHPLDVVSPRREPHGRDRLWPSLRPPLLPPRLP